MTPRTKKTKQETPVDDIIRIMNEQDSTDAEYFCSNCQDKGYILNKNNKAFLCKCQKDKMLIQRYQEANIPKAFYGNTIDCDWNIMQDAYGRDIGPEKEKKEKIQALIKKYMKILPYLNNGHKFSFQTKQGINRNYNSILIKGGNMSGKTLLASIIAQYAIKKGLSVKFYDWTDLCIKLTDYSFKDFHKEIIDDFESNDLIIIDGMSNYKINNVIFKLHLDKLSRTRINSGKLTIITANNTFINSGLSESWQNFVDSLFIIEL